MERHVDRVAGPPIFFAEGMIAAPPPSAARIGAPNFGCRSAAACSNSPPTRRWPPCQSSRPLVPASRATARRVTDRQLLAKPISRSRSSTYGRRTGWRSPRPPRRASPAARPRVPLAHHLLRYRVDATNLQIGHADTPPLLRFSPHPERATRFRLPERLQSHASPAIRVALDHRSPG